MWSMCFYIICEQNQDELNKSDWENLMWRDNGSKSLTGSCYWGCISFKVSYTPSLLRYGRDLFVWLALPTAEVTNALFYFSRDNLVIHTMTQAAGDKNLTRDLEGVPSDVGCWVGPAVSDAALTHQAPEPHLVLIHSEVAPSWTRPARRWRPPPGTVSPGKPASITASTWGEGYSVSAVNTDVGHAQIKSVGLCYVMTNCCGS